MSNKRPFILRITSLREELNRLISISHSSAEMLKFYNEYQISTRDISRQLDNLEYEINNVRHALNELTTDYPYVYTTASLYPRDIYRYYHIYVRRFPPVIGIRRIRSYNRKIRAWNHPGDEW